MMFLFDFHLHQFLIHVEQFSFKYIFQHLILIYLFSQVKLFLHYLGKYSMN